MDQWRVYFAKSGADIWTVIEKAIVLAATDFPVNFKDKRSDIAETLFSRKLLQLRSGDIGASVLSGSLLTDITHLKEEEKREQKKDEVIELAARIEGEGHCCSYRDAEALTDQMEEECLLLKEIDHIKGIIGDSDQSESTIFDALQKLEYMQITVEALKVTELGKHVNALRKHLSKRVRGLVKQLVRNWRGMVDVWVSSAKDATATAMTGLESGKIFEVETEHLGLPLPPLDEGALLAARTAPAEMSQLFSFLDDELCMQPGNREEPCIRVESSVKDNMQYSTKSLSGSISTDFSDYDAKASTSRSGGCTAEEMGSTNRHSNPFANGFEQKAEQASASHGMDCSQLNSGNSLSVGPGRPPHDVVKAKICSGEVPKVNRSHEHQRTHLTTGERSLKPSGGHKSTVPAKVQAQSVEERLECSKRKLSDGYQQARDAKRQHTVQVLDLPDIPKVAVVRGKMNPPAQSRFASQSGHRKFT